jgi:hypothetical protein
MGFLNFLAGLAEIYLAIMVVIVALLFLGLCAGLAWGLRYVEGKSNQAVGKIDYYVAQGRRWERKGLTIAFKPFIEAHVLGASAAGVFGQLLACVRERAGVHS